MLWGTGANKLAILKMVGAPGFEPGASASRTRRATRLRYAPPESIIGGFCLTCKLDYEILRFDNGWRGRAAAAGARK